MEWLNLSTVSPFLSVLDQNGCGRQRFEGLHRMIKHSPKRLVHICSVWHTTVYSSDSTVQNHVSHLIIRNGLIQQVPRVDIGWHLSFLSFHSYTESF